MKGGQIVRCQTVRRNESLSIPRGTFTHKVVRCYLLGMPFLPTEACLLVNLRVPRQTARKTLMDKGVRIILGLTVTGI